MIQTGSAAIRDIFPPVISTRAYSQWTIDNLKYMYYSCVFGLGLLLKRVRLLMQIVAIRL